MREVASDDDTDVTSATTLPAGALIVTRDVLAHPGSSISDITGRTGLPQSHVSESVNKLRVRGIAEISADPADRRRTLVRLTEKHLAHVARHSSRSADDVLRHAFGRMADARAAEIIAVLTELAHRLRTEPPVEHGAAGPGRPAPSSPARVVAAAPLG